MQHLGAVAAIRLLEELRGARTDELTYGAAKRAVGAVVSRMGHGGATAEGHSRLILEAWSGESQRRLSLAVAAHQAEEWVKQSRLPVASITPLHVVNGMVLHDKGASAKLINILILESVSGETRAQRDARSSEQQTRGHILTRSAGHSMY